ncbi:MAG: PEP-CTERM sorting domain-containing protein [Terriglobales bacterium]
MHLKAGSNSFIVGHDDGVVLNVAGFGDVVYAPDATPSATSPFIVNAATAGNYTFTLWYSECCGAPADLEFKVNGGDVGAVPEPGSIALLGSGMLLGLFAMVKFKRFGFNA